MRFRFVALVLVLAVGAAHAQQAASGGEPAKPKPGDIVTNPAYAHWAHFKVGTEITQKEAVTLADGTVVESIHTVKLVSKNKDRLAIESTVVAADAGKRAGAAEETKTRTTYPAKVKFEDIHSADSGGYSVTAGKEAIDVKGKMVDAEWVEATNTNSDGTVTEKDWYAIDIPGGLVKQTVTKKRGSQVTSQSTLETVDVKAKREPKKQ